MNGENNTGLKVVSFLGVMLAVVGIGAVLRITSDNKDTEAQIEGMRKRRKK